MAKFIFNAHGWAFQDGLTTIKNSYDAAHAALEIQIVKARNDIDDYATAIEAGAAWEGEHDEEGHVVWSKEHMLEYHHDEAISAASTLRKAFVIALYHHWERHALKWVDKAQVEHEKLVRKVRAKGYPVADDLEVLYCLCNLLKHNNGKWGNKLVKMDRLDFFRFHKAPPEDWKHWDNNVVVGHHHINQFFQIVGWSGPDAETVAEQQTA